ncbi:LysR substrate-binding domain-containing protein [Aquabacterium sp. A7-Y]|uniref:LysR family transcriptional regulator n=1 Tax=Aquabacterium sp. A7-Y TaxID=1349605 RepID=UPI00223DF433|nr:LysR family transcriptional regulator [Aquabacterium sp. A7-Y]MCW7539456.1 LysR substrate-binding domain-containing protein [Aquabacterium sp. A7-Y]
MERVPWRWVAKGVGRMIQSRFTSRKSIDLMSHIRERDFRGMDLNLLVTLLVLLREKSVSKAAACLHLGQPAISGALSRLRALFKDELLVRSQGGMQPTPRALELQAALAPALELIQAVVSDTPVFDPATATRTFLLGLPDWVDIWLLSPLLAILHREAPGVRVAVVATDPFRVSDMLMREDMDLAVGAFAGGPSWQRQRPLCSMRFCCVHRPGVLRERARLTVKQYTELPHLLVSYRGAFQGTVDEALEKLGQERKVAYTSPRFSSLPRVLQQVPALATVPEVLAPVWERDFGLVSHRLPLDLPPFTVSIAHHATRDKDPALQWLCGVIESVASPSSRARHGADTAASPSPLKVPQRRS